MWQAAMSAAREPVTPSRQHAGLPATRAWGTATTSWAVARVRGAPTAAIINRNAGAKLTQPHGRPASPASSVSRACWRSI
jgi:hypothetical protein